MKYKEIAKSLLSEDRTKAIPQSRFLEIYKEEIGVDPEKLPEIYRGKEGFGPYLGYIEPAKFSRQSAYTENYYTLIIDNSKYWREYPKRSESIICATSESKAGDYGRAYRVFPMIGSKIGVCSEPDIWDSFPYLENEVGIWDLQNLNSVLRKLGDVCLDGSINEENWQSFQKNLNKIPKCDSFERLYQEGRYPPDIDQFLTPFKLRMKNLAERYYPNYTSFYKMIEDLLNPMKNNFNLESFHPNNNLPDNVEVWTDGPSLLVPVSMMGDLKAKMDSSY